MKPRVMTAEEQREEFLQVLEALADYWPTVVGSMEEAVDGMVFSMLTMLDGGNGVLPGFEVVPAPHPDDKQYHQAEGKNWWPPLKKGVVGIHGDCMLHEVWSMRKQKQRKESV